MKKKYIRILSVILTAFFILTGIGLAFATNIGETITGLVEKMTNQGEQTEEQNDPFQEKLCRYEETVTQENEMCIRDSNLYEEKLENAVVEVYIDGSLTAYGPSAVLCSEGVHEIFVKAKNASGEVLAESCLLYTSFDQDYPAAFVVFDKVTSTNKEFKKKWLLHSVEEPEVNGTTTVISRTKEGYNGKLVNKTMLPSSFTIDKVGGAGYESYVDGVNYLCLLYTSTVIVNAGGEKQKTTFNFYPIEAKLNTVDNLNKAASMADILAEIDLSLIHI